MERDTLEEAGENATRHQPETPQHDNQAHSIRVLYNLHILPPPRL